jgi:hypothetical protein
MKHAALLMFVVGCEADPIGHSGVSSKTAVVDLTDAEAMALCNYIFELTEQPEREVDCGDGRSISVGVNPEDVAEGIAMCVAQFAGLDASCVATVGEFERCFEESAAASDDVICSPDLIPSCFPVARCT